MLRKRVVIDFDSEKISVMANGVLLKVCPSAVIRKASETPVAIAYGEETIAKKNSLSENEVYCNPIKYGKIVDEMSAKILFRSLLRDLFGKNTFITLYIIVSGGLNSEDKRTIERVLLSCGYSRVYLLPRPKLISRLLGFNNLLGALYMDADIAEFVLAHNGEIISAHTIDVSVSALAELLRERFLSDSKLKLNNETSLSIAKNKCSLFENDLTKVIAPGYDAITSNSKSVYFTSRDVYSLTKSIYKKITDLIGAVLLDSDTDFSLNIASSGILFLGTGVRICGFEEFTYKSLGFGGLLEKNNFILLSVASSIIQHEPEWIEANVE